MFANQPAQFGCVAQLMPLDAFPDAVENFFGSANADIGRDEREFQLVEQVGVDLLFALECIFEGVDKSGARFLNAALQAIEQRRLLFDRAEESLDHFELIVAEEPSWDTETQSHGENR